MSNDVEVIVEITLLNDNEEIFKCNSNVLSDATNLKILEEVDNYYYKRRENEDDS